MFAEFSLCLIAKIFDFFLYFFLKNQIKEIINKNKNKNNKIIKIKIKTFFLRDKFFF